VFTDIRVSFGQKLRRLRKRRKWTQAEMADIPGLDRSYLAEIEEGKRNVCVFHIKVIADELKVSLSKLFRESEFGDHDVQ
jgi:transcriptional regulator with XRE-family HTH domain